MGSLLERSRTGGNSFGDKGGLSPTSDPEYTKGRLVSSGPFFDIGIDNMKLRTKGGV